MSQIGGLPPGSIITPSGMIITPTEEKKKDDKKKKPRRKKKKKNALTKNLPKNPFTVRETYFMLLFFSPFVGAFVSNMYAYLTVASGHVLTNAAEGLKGIVLP